MDFIAANDRIDIVYPLKEQLNFGTFTLSADGLPGDWSESALGEPLPDTPAYLHLQMIAGQPALAFSTIEPDAEYFAYLGHGSASSPATWRVEEVYKPYSFSFIEGLADWEGKPCFVAADSGCQLILGKIAQPAAQSDWYLCRPAEKNEMYFEAQLLTDAGPALIYSDSRGFHLVTYKLPPKAIDYGGDPEAKAWALRQVYPFDDLIRMNESFQRMQGSATK